MVLKGFSKNTVFYEYTVMSSVDVIKILSSLAVGLGILQKKSYFRRKKFKNSFNRSRVSNFFRFFLYFRQSTIKLKLKRPYPKGGETCPFFIVLLFNLQNQPTPHPLGRYILLI